MFLFKKAQALQAYLEHIKSTNQCVGFVPTMGALHQGHLDLIKQSIEDCDYTICSIFVNPTQFNEPSDLEKYPRTPAKDIALLERVGCDVLFMPSVMDVYPPGLPTQVNISFKGLDEVMEGTFRPGHFEGVAQVVKRLLDLVQPDQLYLGQKDFQQYRIVQHMLEQLQLPISLIMAPISRDDDGLAMSSRNVRLSPKGRATAPVLYQILQEVRNALDSNPPTEAIEKGKSLLDGKEVKLEYLEVVNRQSLRTMVSSDEPAVICIAAWIDGVRLIDNVLVN